MKLKYFTLKQGKKLTANWLKGAWRKIVLTVHPDKGGNHDDYVEAQNEYDYLLARVGATFTAHDDSPENPEFNSFDDFLASISDPGAAILCQQVVTQYVRIAYFKISQISFKTIIALARFRYIKKPVDHYPVAMNEIVRHSSEGL